MIISDIYIGTDFVDKLICTLIHEYTHLIVGIKRNHDYRFNSIYEYLIKFCGVDSVSSEVDRERLKLKSESHKPFKYELWAVAENGDRIHIGGYFRKDKKYTNYCSSQNNWSVDDKRIARIEYVDA